MSAVDRLEGVWVCKFSSLGREYIARLYPDLRLTITECGYRTPTIDIVAMSSGCEKFFLKFGIHQREHLLDLLMRAYRRGCDDQNALPKPSPVLKVYTYDGDRRTNYRTQEEEDKTLT